MTKLVDKLIKRVRKRKEAINGTGGIAGFIVDQYGLITTIFVIAFFVCLAMFPLVKVNYDLTEYLPQSAVTRESIDVMEEEFGYPGTARVMIRDVSIYEAAMYKQMLEGVEGVDMVSWMSADVFMGGDFTDAASQSDYYKDRCAVMDITFKEGDYADSTDSAIVEIQEMLGDKAAYAGPAIETKSLIDNVSSEIVVIMILAVLIILVILLITTTSWLEPLLFLAVMGIAIMLNQGSNLMFGRISFLSQSVASVLQLATSMDYSIFLLETFETMNHEHPGNKPEAMKRAINASAVSILSSAMTTFVGFVALGTMSFTLGADIGFVLGKSIICSVLTVLLLMPALILKFDDKIEKYKHKSFMPKFEKSSRAIFGMRYVVLALMAIIVVPAYIAQSMNDYSFGNSAMGRSEGTQVYDDSNEIEEKFGRSDLYLLIVPNGDPVRERQMAEELKDLYYVRSCTGLSSVLPEGIPESIVPSSITSLLRSDNYARMLLYTRTSIESELAFQTNDEITGIVKRYYPNNSYVVGHTPSTQEIKTIILNDYLITEGFSVMGIAVVVMIAFKSLLLPILVLIPIGVALFLNMATPYIQGETLMFTGYVIVSCVQMGATVDYSILMTNNYLASREEGMTPFQSGINTLRKSISSIITSGMILTLAGYSIYFISSVSAISSIGHMIGRGGFMSMLMVMVAIPALMSTFDGLIFRERELSDRIFSKNKPHKKVELKKKKEKATKKK